MRYSNNDFCVGHRRYDEPCGSYEGYGRFRFEPCPPPDSGSRMDPWPWERNAGCPVGPIIPCNARQDANGFGSSLIILLIAALIRF